MELGALPFDHKLVRGYLAVVKQQNLNEDSESSPSSSDKGESSEEEESEDDLDYGILTFL
jgi:hypothetical protein